jgi:small subunit ribosomal protein S17
MEKTAVVEAVWKQRHRLYGKQMRRVARYRVHDPSNQCQVGDLVRIEETRPISKTKHWRILEIMQRRQVAEVQPSELEADAEIAAADPEGTVEAGADATPEATSEDTGDVAAAQTEEADQAEDDSPTDSVDEDAPSGEEPGEGTSGETGQDEADQEETKE